ncbi:hypothetical protein [Fredinandcohnia quinoae]|uniref:Lipoprotein n=1 Tax=Fredinandcohnia quinoae TaxID=2918902 RepID=A0AAW5EG88_9BACI|nr:hypothetical protein [Fredinandcohnia sp. SECRCQ15]MCH1627879.1 hypothetical protein [Fredinandcohnia sp. SECRCQ15]
MKQAIGVIVMLIIFCMAGCDRNDNVIKEQQDQIIELEDRIVVLEDILNEKQKIINNQNKEFSYLNGFTKEELEAYELFSKAKDTQYLIGLSPVKIVLIYYHSVVIDDVEAIYSLIYDDGTLPDQSTFRQKYYKGSLSKYDLENTIDFRYYNSIKMREDNKTENTVAVEMSVIFGQFQATNLYELKKENEIWKMNILHLMK